MWTEQLDGDPLLLDYFNKFLSSEAFTIQLSYDALQKDFSIVSSIPSLEVDDRFQSKLLYWIEEQRFDAFLKSRVYHTYELHQQILQECSKTAGTSSHVPTSRILSASLPSTPLSSAELNPARLPRRRALSIGKPVEVSDLRSTQLPSIPSAFGQQHQITKSTECSSYEQNMYGGWDQICSSKLDCYLNVKSVSEVLDKAERMDGFCKFLLTTKGRYLIDVWLDVKELEELHTDLELQELLNSSGSADSSPRPPLSFSHNLSYKHLKTHLELKYSHMLTVEGSSQRRSLKEAKSSAFHKLNSYWLPRYVMQTLSHHSVGNTVHLPELARVPCNPHLPAPLNGTGLGQPENEFTAGLRAEASASRPLMKYFMRSSMFDLARMLLFWQSVDELRMLEEKGVEDTIRDRLSWSIYKEFVMAGGEHSLPVSSEDCSQIAANLHQGYMTTRLTAFSNLPALCLSCLKRAWSSYLRANYEEFVCRVGKTPVPPSRQPTPLLKSESAKSLRRSAGKKRKKKKKRKGKKDRRSEVAQLASRAYIEEALSRVASLDKVKSSGMIHHSQLSRAQASRVSRNSNKMLSQVLPTSDPLSNYLDDFETPMHPKLVAFIAYMKNLEPKNEFFQDLRNVEFCLEVNKLKAIVSAKTDFEIVQKKVEAIVDNYLDLVRPPWLLVSIPSNLVLRIVEVVAQHTEGFVSQPSSAMVDTELELLEWAKQVVLATLLPTWGEFLVKWHNSKLESKKKKKQRSGGRRHASPSSGLPSVTSIPFNVPPAEKMKITYSLTTGAFWTSGQESSTKLRSRPDL